MRGLVVAFAVLLASAGLCEAQNKPADPPTPEQAADQALAASKAKDAAKLKELASMERPDPWRVVDALLARDAVDVALAYSKASPRPDVVTLPAYVESRRGKPDDADTRRALTTALAALDAKKPADALAAIEGAHPKGGDILAILFETAHGDALRGMGRFEECEAVYGRVGEAAEEMGWLFRVAYAAYLRGTSASLRSDLPAALAAWERRLEIERRRGLPGGIGDALSNVATMEFQLGRYAKALECLGEALKIHEGLGNRNRLPPILVNTSTVHENLGDHAVAREFAERALKVAEELGDRSNAALALINLGMTDRALGEFSKAVEFEERARKISEELGNRAGVATALSELGDTHMFRGDYPTALDCLRRSLAIQEELRNRPGIATAIASMGAVHMSLGEYAQSIEELERARKMREELGDRAGLAKVMTNMGVAYALMGDPARALEFHQRSLRIAEEIGNRAGVLINLTGVANDYLDMKDYAKALEFHQRALQLSQELHDSQGVARSLSNIGIIQRNLGDPAKALETAQRALKMAEDMGDRCGAARVMGQIGFSYNDLHRYSEAVPILRQTLVRAEEVGDRDLVAGTHWNLAVALAGAGDLPGAMASAHSAVLESRLLTKGNADEQSTSTRARFDDVFAIGAAVAAKLGNAAEAAFFVESGRAGTLLESLRGREALRAAAVPADLRDEETAARSAETAAVADLRKALDSRKLADIAACRKALDAAHDRVRDVVERIQRESKSAAGLLYPECDKLDVLQSRMREGEALVCYVRYADDRMGALVVEHGGTRIVTLGATKDVEAACEALATDDPKRDAEAAAAALTKLVVDPLALDAKVKRVLVSPDGALSYVPFALLLGEREVAYVPSGTTYGLLLDEREKKGEGVLALGDPDYGSAKADTTGAVAMRGGMNLMRLPATGIEAKAVGDVVLVGKDATEEGLRDALKKKPRWHAVHLACHGLVDAERPMLSSLALTPAGDDDGFLTALEIFRMKLPADLVVLSACETGKGKVVKAEGIVGLTRAFMFAGAPRVLVSMWKVDDQVTAALMAKFYEGFKKGVPAARALREAQASVRAQEKWKHPFYWAAWSLWGLPD
jgi:CHAT domain-containing protein/tetratricopeptide (TPR) repeat protein